MKETFDKRLIFINLDKKGMIDKNNNEKKSSLKLLVNYFSLKSLQKKQANKH